MLGRHAVDGRGVEEPHGTQERGLAALKRERKKLVMKMAMRLLDVSFRNKSVRF